MAFHAGHPVAKQMRKPGNARFGWHQHGM